ncbi:MAG: hypothetical protein JXR76_06025 [Deltaproteobacteria bacterium]|nr:hypothetical protein [Deltaproteobacteria bacterium]
MARWTWILSAVGMTLLICQMSLAQLDSKPAPKSNSDAIDAEPEDEAQDGGATDAYSVQDDEIPGATSEEADAVPSQKFCMPALNTAADGEATEDTAEDVKKSGEDVEDAPLAADKENVLDEKSEPEMQTCVDDADCAEGEICTVVEAEPVYVPVEPPPVLSDEISFVNPANPSAEATRAAQADYEAVVGALGQSQELPYRNYQREVPDRRISFSQYVYEDYRSSRRIGVAVMAIGIPIFGGLTALGIVSLADAAQNDCLPSNDTGNECEAPEQESAKETRDRGIFLTIFGAAGAVTSVVIGAVKIKRASGPLSSLEPLVEQKKNAAKRRFQFEGFSPVVSAGRRVAPGSALSFSF